MTAVDSLAMVLVLGAGLLLVYTYLGYPALLWLLGRFSRTRLENPVRSSSWPMISMTVPVFNEEHQVASLLRNLLDLDYPSDLRQILIVSDASTDSTDEIVRTFATEGVELLRMEVRGGKSKAENAAVPRLRGSIIVNTDASIRFPKDSLKKLISAFRNPTVGLASGRDISVGSSSPDAPESNLGESGYVGYEMAIRDLETRVSGIVGASGCYYAIRRGVHETQVPESLSRDFAAALNTWEHGYRPVSVPNAICWVPRTTSLRVEYSRKVRTITRGIQTLHFKRALLNPLRFPIPAWMLVSHKLCRWALPWAGLGALVGVSVLAFSYTWAKLSLALCLLFLLMALAGWMLDGRLSVPRLLSIPAFVMVGNVAAAHAFVRFVRGASIPIWEPTRRGSG